MVTSSLASRVGSCFTAYAYHGIRFDLVLLAIIDEVAALYRLNVDRFRLHGFSGGGHFVHRFFYLHPERLQGVSIGAPGSAIRCFRRSSASSPMFL